MTVGAWRIVKASYYLLNPAHPDFARIAIGPRQLARFDPRLMKRP